MVQPSQLAFVEYLNSLSSSEECYIPGRNNCCIASQILINLWLCVYTFCPLVCHYICVVFFLQFYYLFIQKSEVCTFACRQSKDTPGSFFLFFFQVEKKKFCPLYSLKGVNCSVFLFYVYYQTIKSESDAFKSVIVQ